MTPLPPVHTRPPRDLVDLWIDRLSDVDHVVGDKCAVSILRDPRDPPGWWIAHDHTTTGWRYWIVEQERARLKLAGALGD